MNKRYMYLAVSYRFPRMVTHQYLYWSGDTYAVCPRCYSSLDREYMSYCNRCGQRLDWRVFDAAITVSVPLQDHKGQTINAENYKRARKVKLRHKNLTSRLTPLH